MLTVVGRVKGLKRSHVQGSGSRASTGVALRARVPSRAARRLLSLRPCGGRASSRQQAWSSGVCSAGVVGGTLPTWANRWGRSKGRRGLGRVPDPRGRVARSVAGRVLRRAQHKSKVVSREDCARRRPCLVLAGRFLDVAWLEGSSTRLREMQAVAQLDRASFVYANNDNMTSEVKDALAGFDQDKTGRVSTSELVAGAKALQEVRRRGRERLVGLRKRRGSDLSVWTKTAS